MFWKDVEYLGMLAGQLAELSVGSLNCNEPPAKMPTDG
jgi:hypothetical protein